MIEIPEAVVLSRQLTECLAGKKIARIIAGVSPHKFTWYYGDRESYAKIAVGKTFRGARAVGGMVEAVADDVRLLFSEGINLRYLKPGAPGPAKHQLLLSFHDDSALVASVQMYGGIGAFRVGENDNKYYLLSLARPSPLEAEFDERYFDRLVSEEGVERLSAKAFLATEQRIPGLGNGVLQDILYFARVNPRRKIGTLGPSEREQLYRALKKTLRQMAEQGGRDTESDLFGEPGSYRTIMSRKTTGSPCPHCGHRIEKAAYMGGSVYLCPECQPV